MSSHIKNAYIGLLTAWGVDPRGRTKSTGSGVRSTGDGRIVIGHQKLRPKEMRKLLEAFYNDNRHLPRDPYEFERWLNS